MISVSRVTNIAPIEENCNTMCKPEKVVDHYLITWVIKGIFGFRRIFKSISSPRFYINSDSWLILLTNHGKKVEFHLHREPSGTNSSAIDVTYKLGIKECLPHSRKHTFSAGDSDSVLYDAQLYIGSMIKSIKTALTIQCEMYLVYDKAKQLLPEYNTREALGLFGLSLDLLSMCGKEQDSDVIIRSNNADIYAHKAILSARSSFFARRLKNESLINIPAEDSVHINNILKYIYSGRINWIAIDEISIGLYECAQRYGVEGLINVLTPSGIGMRSKFTAETDITRYIVIDKAGLDKLNADKIYECPPDSEDDKDSCQWNIEITLLQRPKSGDYIGFYIRPSDFINISNISADVCILDKNLGIHFKRCITRPLYLNFLYGEQCYIYMKELHDEGLLEGNKLTFEFKIKYTLTDHCLVKYVVQPAPLAKYPCLEWLSRDLEKLLVEKDFRDYIFVVDEKSVMKFHKVIISARCPSLSLILESASSNQTVKTTMDKLVEEIIHYAYTGKLKLSDMTVIAGLYCIARNFSLYSHFYATCAALIERIDENSVMEFILLANHIEDQLLMKACLNYIKEYEETIRNSMKWKRLVPTKGALLMKILAWLRDPSSEISFV